jgi:hypothetical protein
VDQAARLAFLDDLAQRRVSLKELAGVGDGTLAALEQLATSAFQGGRFDDAAQLFGFLEALEPERAEHALYRGHAAASAGDLETARDALTRYLAREDTPADEREKAAAFLEGLW